MIMTASYLKPFPAGATNTKNIPICATRRLAKQMNCINTSSKFNIIRAMLLSSHHGREINEKTFEALWASSGVLDAV